MTYDENVLELNPRCSGWVKTSRKSNNKLREKFSLMVPVPFYIIFVADSFLYIHYQEDGMVYVMCLYCCATKNIFKKRAYAFCRNRSFTFKVYKRT
jgi:hypothetical protein